MSEQTRYKRRDTLALGNLYIAHLDAMTTEGLYNKCDIAAELAYRDARVAELEAELSAGGGDPMSTDNEQPFTHPDVAAWRKKGRHLPPFLRDFHDQKALFKAIASVYGPQQKEYEVNWMRAQVYVIDRFLWFLATHGYTIQRSRAKLPFRDIRDTLDSEAERMVEVLSQMMNEALEGGAA